DPLFMPALGGPRPKLDPRFADKIRPVEKKDGKKGEDSPADRQRNELGSRQQEKLKELKSAEMSLQSDEETLAALLDRLRETAQLPEMSFPRKPDAQTARAQSPEAPPARPQTTPPELDAQDLAGRLAELMQSPEMREARSMMTRMQQLQARAAARAQNPNQPQAPKQPAAATQASTFASLPAVSPESALDGVDLDTRTLILKMQPRVREELLQGLKEEGPDGYQKFIRNYFQRLARVNSEKK